VRPARAAALALVCAAAATTAASCASVIGIQDYEDAVDALCKCPALLEVDDCKKVATERLAKDAKKRASWIKGFSEDCLCDKADECFDRSPTCTPNNGKCTSTTECCGNTEGKAACCTNLTGPYCCGACDRCKQVLDRHGALGPPSCIESQELIDNFIGCICQTCVDTCGASVLCGGSVEDPGPLCGACFENSVKMDGNCIDEASACVIDVPD